MKTEITAAAVEFAAGPFLRLHQRVAYRVLGLCAESTLPSDLIGAAARVLALLATWLALPVPVLLASLAVVAWAGVVAVVEVAVALCTSRRR